MTAHVKLAGQWSTVDQIYARVGGSWKEVAEGYVKISGNWEQFFASGVPLTVQYLVVAGGGGGGRLGAGGGGGGYRSSVSGESSGGGGSAESALSLAVSTNYTVTIGAGGAGRTATNGRGSNGANSVFSTITSTGGGGGAGATELDGATGGSGGGAFTSGSVGAGTTNQGYAGGTGIGTDPAAGGGGGGAAAVGGNAVTGTAGSGGSGVASAITGSSVTRAGGGGSGSASVWTAGLGVNGGGNGSNSPTVNGGNGTANSGGGGGGSGYTSGIGVSNSGGNGGSGVVIIKYPDTYAINVSAGLSHRTTTSGGYRVTQFTAGTGTISFSEAVTSAYELIATTYLSASQASVTFDVSGLGSRYQHLQIRWLARKSTASGGGTMYFRFNGDTGSNYSRHALRGEAGAVSSIAASSQTFGDGGIVAGNSATANAFAAGVTDILDPFNSSKNTTIRTLNGLASSTNYVSLTSSAWYNTASLTSILMYPDSDSWVSGSRFSLYGLRKA